MPVRKPVLAALATMLLFVAACGGDSSSNTTTTGGGATTTGASGATFTPMTDGVLTVGTELPAPPFWIGDDYDSLTGGFEFDLAHDIADKLGLDETKIVTMPFAGLVAGQECPCDVDFSQVTITDDRAKVVDFSVPYFDADQGVLVKKGTEVKTLDDAKALQWGVQINTTGLDLLNTTVKPSKETRTYDTTVDAFNALQAGQIDAVLLDTPIVLGEAKENTDFEVVAQFKTGEQYGAVLKKDSPNLAAFNAALQSLIDDGTVSELLTKYFGADPKDIPVISTS
jgi:polar amino acid transport system substrate-binding protein